MRREKQTQLTQSASTSRNSISDISHYQGVDAPPATAFDKWLTRNLLSAIGSPPLLFRLWDGEEIAPRGITPEAILKINNRIALIKLCIDPEFNFGELYSSRDVDVEGNLVRFLHVAYSAIHFKPKTLSAKILEYIQHHRSNSNSLSRTRKNIYHHYDIGNEFYEQWLDRAAMQYTCAYFPDPAMTLEEAQIAKMHHICRKLKLEPGMTVVEAGCGWGGFARFMAKEYSVQVKAYNISHKQVQFAREQARVTGLSDQVDYIEDDYRNIEGQFDRFVSVGMLEHIGINNYHELGNVIDRSLNENGFGLIHTIGRNQPCLLNAWIEARIFPGACPPSLSQMMEIFEPLQFSIHDVENLRLHYAKTLQHWLNRFDICIEQFREDYDDAFIRTWRLYLAGSIAAFQAGTMQLFQVLFSRARNNQLDWSRSHLYQNDEHP